MPQLSACIITLNEQRDLPRCLASVTSIADEIVVVDSGSSDCTREIARANGALVFERPFSGYAAQKQYALDKATGEWALCLDADEWLDEELSAAVRAVFAAASDSQADGYLLNRRCRYLGRWMKHGPWSSEWRLRLVCRRLAHWTGEDPHDRLDVEGNVRRLDGHLLHEPYANLSEHLEKISRYTSLLATTNRRPSLVRLLMEPPLTFLKFFFLQAGILDGHHGLIAASMSAFYTLTLQIRLLEKHIPGDAVIRFTHGAIRWEAAADSALTVQGLLREQPELIRGASTKRIERWRQGGRLFYIKRYLHGARRLRPLKYWMKRTRARHEWELALELQNRRVDVVPHLAYGERWAWWGLLESMLITEAPPDVSHFEPADLASAEFQRDFGAFIRRMHDAGLSHGDPNTGNFLYSNQTRRFYLVDLDKASLQQGALDGQREIEALARLSAVFNLSPAFYVGCGKPALASLLKEPADRARRRLLEEEVLRRLPPRHHSGVEQRHESDVDWVVRRELDSDSLGGLLRNPDRELAAAGALLKASRSSTVWSDGGWIVKRYNLTRPWKWLKANLRGSYAKRSFRLFCHLELAGIASARPVAFGDRRRLGLISASYLVTEWIQEARPLDEAREQIAGALTAAAALIAALHTAGFVQSDPKSANVLLDSGGRCYLVDTDGVRYISEVSDSRARVELRRLAAEGARLGLPPRRSLAFLRAYCNARGITDWRGWWRKQAR